MQASPAVIPPILPNGLCSFVQKILSRPADAYAHPEVAVVSAKDVKETFNLGSKDSLLEALVFAEQVRN